MLPLLTAIARLFSTPPSPAGSGPVRTLFERAGARAGQDPCEARELRAAAQAYLRVVR